jgi:hypothetical protein
MPLSRVNTREPIIGLDIHSVRFPLTDGKNLIWGEVSDLALRERAMRDEVKTGLEKRALFERYRQILEGLASELFDEGKLTEDKSLGVLLVRVPNGSLSQKEKPRRGQRGPKSGVMLRANQARGEGLRARFPAALIIVAS